MIEPLLLFSLELLRQLRYDLLLYLALRKFTSYSSSRGRRDGMRYKNENKIKVVVE